MPRRQLDPEAATRLEQARREEAARRADLVAYLDYVLKELHYCENQIEKFRAEIATGTPPEGRYRIFTWACNAVENFFRSVAFGNRAMPALDRYARAELQLRLAEMKK